jgi:uncharacterized protein YcaQ
MAAGPASTPQRSRAQAQRIAVRAQPELVGKLDATADRKAGVLRVDAIHPDTEITPPMEAAIGRELRDLAGWLGLPLERPDD